MKHDKDHMIELISEGVHMSADVCCSKCDKEDGTDNITDDEDAANDFYEMGWRATVKNIYCPECAKIYLKSRK